MKPSIITRLGLGWDAFKAQMRFPSSSFMGGGGIRPASGFYTWDDLYNRFQGTQIDYYKEVGDLTQSSLIMAAVNYAGRRLPEAPIKVYEEDANEKQVPIKKHLLELLIKRPNPFYSGATLMKSFALNWLIDGNVYWRVLRNARGYPVQLWPIPYWMITPAWNDKNPESYIESYRYKVNNSTEYIPVDDIIHFRDGEDPNNSRKGMSPIKSLLREVYSDNEIGNFAATLLKNGGIPDFILSPAEGSFTDPEARQVAEQFQARRTGDNRGKAIGVNRSIKVEKLTFEPDKLDLSRLRTISETRLAAVIGIPAVILGFQMEKAAKYKNMEEAADQATEGFLKPLWDYQDDELNHQLLPQFEMKENQVVAHDLTKVQALQEDRNEFSARICNEYKSGIITRKEAKEQLGYEFDELLDSEYFSSGGGLSEPDDELMKSLTDGKPDKYELALMRSSWRKHVPKRARGLYLSGNGSE